MSLPKPTDTQDTSNSLLVGMCAQDLQSWQRFVFVYTPLIERWCRQQDLQQHDCFDVIQDVLLRVSQSIDRFERRGKGSFRAWLKQITRNSIVDHFRAKGEVPIETWIGELLESPAGDAEYDAHAEAAASSSYKQLMMGRALRAIKGDFSESTWNAFWRFTIDQQSAAAVGEEFKMTPNAVRKAKARVLRRLKDEFDGLDILD